MKVKKEARPKKESPVTDEPHITPKKVQDFKKGNINFDFLQPEGESQTKETLPFQSERRLQAREGKRGLFNRGRKVRPMGPWSLVFWSCLVLGSLGGLIGTFWLAAPLLRLLLIPLLSLCILGGLIMLALIQARPG